jgi:hypothetical protein
VRIPGIERAVVDAAKIRDYLLSASHPVGRFKSRFFVRLGYTPDLWETLADDIRHHGRLGTATEGESSPYGRKFEVRGSLKGPTGRTAEVVSIWILLNDSDVPRFVTAFPD